MTELSDLVVEHVLTGVSFIAPEGYTQPDTYYASDFWFTLDGVTYVAREDESDGYRSMLGEILVVDGVTLSNVFAPVNVRAVMQSDDEILDLIDTANGKTILSVGTCYPYFVSDWMPQNMAVNDAQT